MTRSSTRSRRYWRTPNRHSRAREVLRPESGHGPLRRAVAPWIRWSAGGPIGSRFT